MKESQYDFIANDFVDGIISFDEEDEQCEYYKVSVEKILFSDIYLKVPKGTKFTRNDKKFQDALDEQMNSFFWGDEADIDYGNSQIISEKEAKEYGFTDFS